jgi:hypothetical protein
MVRTRRHEHAFFQTKIDPAIGHPLGEVISTAAQWQDVTTNSLPSITHNVDSFVSFAQFVVEHLS